MGAKSVLGPVSIELTPDALLRENASGTLRVPWPSVRFVAEAATLLVVQLDGKKLLLVPARAFADDAERTAFHRRVQELSAKPLETIPQA